MSRSSKAEFCWKVFANEGLLEDPEASSSRDKGSSFTELMAGKRERMAGRQASEGKQPAMEGKKGRKGRKERKGLGSKNPAKKL